MRFSDSRACFFSLGLILTFSGLLLAFQAKDGPQPPREKDAADAASGYDWMEVLHRVDADQDGFITQSEWRLFFDKSDGDADKRLNPEEMRAMLRRNAAEEALEAQEGRLAAFRRLDADASGGIESAEWPGRERDFRYLDADHNGSLSREEFLSRNGLFWNQTFDNLDFNGDGLILRSEWLDSDPSFNRLDRDRNGVIERREFYNPR